MSTFLIRHASAGDRGQWRFDDQKRPLDEKGQRQAQQLVELFAKHTLATVWSSPAIRCMQTVGPLASSHSIDIEVRTELCEGASSVQLLKLIHKETAATPGDLVLCSHGDVISGVVNCLLRAGIEVNGASGCAKGSVWELKTANGVISEGIYTARP